MLFRSAENARSEYRELVESAEGREDVVFIDGDVTSNVRDSMLAAADCYVSLHRSEGLGLTMAEAMYFGKPVIATGYSGNVDFMDATNSLLIDYQLTPVGVGADPYPSDAVWADPDIEQAARSMRRVFEDSVLARSLGRRAAASIRETNSLESASRAIVDWLTVTA